MEEQIKQIETESERVAREHAEHQAAIGAERDAEAAVLERVIAIVRPALRAITTAVMDANRPGSDEETGDTIVPARLCRAVKIAVGDEEVQGQYHRDMTVEVDGRDLWLRDDGTLVVIRYEGTESQWAGYGRVERTSHEITARKAMDTYDLAPCVAAILAALAKDRRADATQAARERTSKLAAVLALL